MFAYDLVNPKVSPPPGGGPDKTVSSFITPQSLVTFAGGVCYGHTGLAGCPDFVWTQSRRQLGWFLYRAGCRISHLYDQRRGRQPNPWYARETSGSSNSFS